ncbi:zinc ribbon domain-containing protein [Lacipirellula sp.]|uniref:zinc ribbon domain-containing protein n=1 Tax=Lacipirellula sp. TaxID=2691419 RepID=UPI003D0FAB35
MADAKSRLETLIFRCESCNGKLSAKLSSVGKTFTCPKCQARVTVHALTFSQKAGSGVSQEAINEFVFAVKLIACNPVFVLSDECDNSQLMNRYWVIQGDQASYPGEVLTLLTGFAGECERNLQLHRANGRPLPYVDWEGVCVARSFARLYRAMKGCDECFATPFHVPDESWFDENRSEEDILKVVVPLIENLGPASKAFTKRFQNSESFNRRALEVAFRDAAIDPGRRPAPPVKPPSIEEPVEKPTAAAPSASCSRCHATLQPHHLFCGACGAPKIRQCHSCNRPAEASDRFCPGCGTSLAK